MNKEVRELTCIGCPMGCLVYVEIVDGEVNKVYGNSCIRGDSYAREEVTSPTRIVTSTVYTDRNTMLSVKTESPIPKGKIYDCMSALKDVHVKAPKHIGDVVVENIADTGINVIATKELF